MRIDLGTVFFNNGPDVNGVNWLVTNLEGWANPELRQTFHPITSADGEVIGEAAYGGWPVILTGVVKAPNATQFWSAYNTLPVVAGLYTPVALKVYETPTPKILQVVMSDRPRLSIMVGANAFEFQLTVRGTNPVKTT